MYPLYPPYESFLYPFGQTTVDAKPSQVYRQTDGSPTYFGPHDVAFLPHP